jgi:hypothetical protein
MTKRTDEWPWATVNRCSDPRREKIQNILSKLDMKCLGLFAVGTIFVCSVYQLNGGMLRP